MKRKFFVFSILLYMPIALLAQENDSFTLRGTIVGTSAKKVYLRMTDLITKEGVVDSTFVIDGKFVFRGKLPRPVYGGVSASDGSFGAAFWMGNENVTIRAIAGMHAADIQGSVEQDIMNVWNGEEEARFKASYDEMTGKVKNARAMEDEVALKQAEKEKKDWEKGYAAFREDMIKKYPRSYFALNSVDGLWLQDKYRYEDLSRVFGYIDPELQDCPQGRRLARAITELKKTSVGQLIPDVAEHDADGHEVKISDYRGKYLLLTIGGIGVSTYDMKISDRISLYNKYHDSGLDMLDILWEKDASKMKKMTIEKKIPWILISDLKSAGNAANKILYVEKIPTTFLLDPNGRILAVDMEDEPLEMKIKELLNK